MNYSEEVAKHGSVRKAAKALGIPRTNLQRLLRKEADAITSQHLVGDRLDGHVDVRGLQPASVDAFTAECDRLGLKSGEVRRGWLKTDAGTIQVERNTKSAGIELSPDFVSLLDSARKHVLRLSECKSADSMLVMGLHDAHFGKLAFRHETGIDYDPKITASIYRQAVSDALTHFNPSRIKKVVFPIGSDLFHVDNMQSTTTSGTPVESCDTRFHHVFDIALAAVIAAVEDCVSIADVLVPVVPGNHDANCSVLLAKVLTAYFKDDPRVVVDDDEISRKYLHWGTNLIGFSHRFTKLDSAATVMATEAPAAWGVTTSREIHTGHLHTRRGKEYQPYYESAGVVVRILPSISSTDRWHYDNGFIGSLRAAESYLYSEETGLIGSHLAKVRQ